MSTLVIQGCGSGGGVDRGNPTTAVAAGRGRSGPAVCVWSACGAFVVENRVRAREAQIAKKAVSSVRGVLLAVWVGAWGVCFGGGAPQGGAPPAAPSTRGGKSAAAVMGGGGAPEGGGGKRVMVGRAGCCTVS